MASDFGDESGQQLTDWLLRIGQDGGQKAMERAADSFMTALKHAKDGQSEVSPRDVGRDGKEWAKLDLAEFTKIDGSKELQKIMSDKLKSSGAEYLFFDDHINGKNYLLFKVEDAALLAKSFDELIKETKGAYERASEAREGAQEKRHEKDDRPLEERAEEARKASDSLDKQKEGVISRIQNRMQENRSR